MSNLVWWECLFLIVIIVRLCLMGVLTELYLLLPVTFTIFQCHSSMKQLKLNFAHRSKSVADQNQIFNDDQNVG